MAEEFRIENELHSGLRSTMDFASARAQANRKALLALMAALRAEEDAIRQGGGAKAAEAQHGKGRLTVRERLRLLLDEGAEFLELGLWAANGMYAEYGGAPGAGVVTGLGRVSGRLCMIVANDATVKAGAFFPMTAKKVLRAQTIAMENRIPTLYLVDSSGVFLPLQEAVFPDTDDFGRIFRNNAVMSSMGIPQITAIMGMCVAGGAYLPVMTDTVLMTEGSGLFLAGPSLVQAAIGQKTGPEELGGAAMHAAISGTVDFKEPNDHLCLARLRSLVAKMGERHSFPGSKSGPFGKLRAGCGVPRCFPAARVRCNARRAGVCSRGYVWIAEPGAGSSNVYEMREVIARIVDRSEFDEYKAEFGRTCCAGMRGLAGGLWESWPTRRSTRTRRWPWGAAGMTQMEVGGVNFTEGAQKAARFIMDCNQNLVPLIFLHDVNGLMVGKEAEWSGIIRAGAKMVSAVSTSVVPKIAVIVAELQRRPLCDVRQGLRSALLVCVADGAVSR